MASFHHCALAGGLQQRGFKPWLDPHHTAPHRTAPHRTAPQIDSNKISL
jgi:hypothetical protein